MKNYIVSAEKLQDFTTKIFQGTGLSEADAAKIAELLVHANLRNVHSHGVIRMVPYAEKIRDGGASKDSEYPVVFESPCSAVIDAQGGLGAIAGQKAVELARKKAEACGMSMVVVRNGNHFGMAGHWALKLAGDDMIGYAASTTDLTMGPPGCKEPFMGNNPFAFAFKASDKYPEVCVDMATSGVAMGKAKDLAKRGLPIPTGWMLDKDGNDTTNVDDCYMMVPMAGHKGFCIAFVVEMFATLLSGGVLSPFINNQDLTDTPELASQCFGCVKISAFRDLDEFHASSEAYIEELHKLAMKPGVDSAKYPGEIEYLSKQKNLKEGISLPEKLVEDLVKLGEVYQADTAFLFENVVEQ